MGIPKSLLFQHWNCLGDRRGLDDLGYPHGSWLRKPMAGFLVLRSSNDSKTAAMATSDTSLECFRGSGCERRWISWCVLHHFLIFPPPVRFVGLPYVAILATFRIFSDLFSKLPQMEKQLWTCKSFSAMGGKPRVSTLSCDDFFQKATTIPSGKLTVCYGKSPCLMEKSTNYKWYIFNSFLYDQRV